MATASKNANEMQSKKEYQQLAKKREPARPVLKNCLRAFLVGGSTCLLGQAIMQIFIAWFGFTKDTASDPTVAVLIMISVFLTGIGVYDKLAQWAGAGSSVPVTGFANSMCSAALEHRSEGLVLGVGGNMFKLAGSVIVFGVFSAFIVAIIHMLLDLGGAT